MLRSSWPILVIFALATLTRIFLWNPNGAYFFPDEFRYEILDNSERLLFDIFQIWGRPGFGIFYLPALSVGGPLPALIQNLIINVLNIILVCLIAGRLTNKKTAALVGIAAIFTLPMTTYIRHLLPYDAGLFLILLGIYLWLQSSSGFIFGLFLGLSFLVYPSHFYYFLPIPFMLFALANTKIQERLKILLSFSSGFTLPIVLAEFTSIAIGASSYIGSLRDLSGTVTQGDFILSAIFIKDYILAHSGTIGIIIFLVCAASLAFVTKDKKYKIIAIYLVAMFSILELFSHILETTVLYGRTVRPFYLLALFAGSAAFFETFDKLKFRKIPYVNLLFLTALIANWAPHYTNFKNITYPGDFERLASQGDALRSWQGQFQIVNPPLLYPYYGNADTFLCDKEILLDAPDPLYSFAPYRFEGYDIAMREFLENDPPKHEVFFCK